MKEFKKLLRTIGIILLIVLACFGLGIAGGAPIPVNKRRENNIELRIELKDAYENKSEELVFKNLE